MALIQCEECSAQVSDKAKACPKCGNPIDTVKPEFFSCPKCDHELLKGSLSCNECGNEAVILDSKTGKFREPFDWERKNRIAQPDTNHPNAKPQTGLSDSQLRNLMIGIGAFVVLALILWYFSPYQRCLRAGPDWACKAARAFAK